MNLCNKIDNKEAGEEILSLWLEFEEKKTPEAILVNNLDKFEVNKNFILNIYIHIYIKFYK